jgi:hypothetical protein
MMNIEWLVNIWCKIKRDMSKSNSSEYENTIKKLTIVDFLSIKNENVFQHLLEEINNYQNFRFLIFKILFRCYFLFTNIILDRLIVEL